MIHLWHLHSPLQGSGHFQKKGWKECKIGKMMQSSVKQFLLASQKSLHSQTHVSIPLWSGEGFMRQVSSLRRYCMWRVFSVLAPIMDNTLTMCFQATLIKIWESTNKNKRKQYIQREGTCLEKEFQWEWKGNEKWQWGANSQNTQFPHMKLWKNKHKF